MQNIVLFIHEGKSVVCSLICRSVMKINDVKKNKKTKRSLSASSSERPHQGHRLGQKSNKLGLWLRTIKHVRALNYESVNLQFKCLNTQQLPLCFQHQLRTSRHDRTTEPQCSGGSVKLEAKPLLDDPFSLRRLKTIYRMLIIITL